jgi:hypothetical protein
MRGSHARILVLVMPAQAGHPVETSIKKLDRPPEPVLGLAESKTRRRVMIQNGIAILASSRFS